MEKQLPDARPQQQECCCSPGNTGKSHLDGPRACACGAAEGPGAGTGEILRFLRTPSLQSSPQTTQLRLCWQRSLQGDCGDSARGWCHLALAEICLWWGGFVIHSLPDISVEWLMAGPGVDPGSLFPREVLDNDVPASGWMTPLGQAALPFPAFPQQEGGRYSPCEVSSLEMIHQKLLQGKGLLLRKEELGL